MGTGIGLSNSKPQFLLISETPTTNVFAQPYFFYRTTMGLTCSADRNCCIVSTNNNAYPLITIKNYIEKKNGYKG
jgi:hypothetical protein